MQKPTLNLEKEASKEGFNLGDMVTHKYNLKDIQTGFETAYDKTSGSIKVQIQQ